jgi:hypothetical protein
MIPADKQAFIQASEKAIGLMVCLIKNGGLASEDHLKLPGMIREEEEAILNELVKQGVVVWLKEKKLIKLTQETWNQFQRTHF